MPWNPEVYNQFKSIRYQPFFELADLIIWEHVKTCVDIGCGTGEQTSMLAAKSETTAFLGIDSSREMLAESGKYENDKLQFRLSTIEAFAETDERWDLIFSNAALQWSNEHEILFPKLISKLNAGGQFAVQMPVQHENLLNQLLLDLVQEKPYTDYLQGWKRESPILSIDSYAGILFDCGLEDIQIMQKVYPIIAGSSQELLDFISGSALIPYMERMSATEQIVFLDQFKTRIEKAFQKFPSIYAFKRLLLYGSMGPQ